VLLPCTAGTGLVVKPLYPIQIRVSGFTITSLCGIALRLHALPTCKAEQGAMVQDIHTGSNEEAILAERLLFSSEKILADLGSWIEAIAAPNRATANPVSACSLIGIKLLYG
jgi:hypothetical protein